MQRLVTAVLNRNGYDAELLNGELFHSVLEAKVDRWIAAKKAG